MARKKKTEEPSDNVVPASEAPVTQTEIPMEGPGVAPKKIPAIEKAAARHKAFVEERCALLEKEKGAKGEVIRLLLEHKDEIGVDKNGEILYRLNDELISLKPGKEQLTYLPIGGE